jgi:DNA modification methylase
VNHTAIKASLTRFGQAEPLVVQASTKQVIGGNGRLAAMQELGWTECDVVELDLDDQKAAALGIALNRTAEFATWDESALAEILQSLDADGALDGTGYSHDDLNALLDQLGIEGTLEGDIDDVPEPQQTPVSRRGDLWRLGEHHLLCGDSTSRDDVARLMGDQRAALVATDPPYLVDYTGDRPNDSGKDWTHVYHEIDIKDANAFFRAVFTNILTVLAPKAAIYCWHAHKRSGEIQRIWHDLGILDHQQIIWVKPTPVFGRVYWHFRHEPCMMGWKKGEKPDHDGQHEFDSVWEVDWEGRARSVDSGHPTSKPAELFARPMRKHTKVGDICFEPFSGSGSCLVAAEKLGRRCRAIEIEPVFVDVAVRRWENATRLAARLDGTNQTFAEVAASRGVVVPGDASTAEATP